MMLVFTNTLPKRSPCLIHIELEGWSLQERTKSRQLMFGRRSTNKGFCVLNVKKLTESCQLLCQWEPVGSTTFLTVLYQL